MFRERATDQFDSHRGAVNPVPIPSFTFPPRAFGKTDIPKLFMVDAFEGIVESRGKGKDWIDTGAREFLRREFRTQPNLEVDKHARHPESGEAKFTPISLRAFP